MNTVKAIIIKDEVMDLVAEIGEHDVVELVEVYGHPWAEGYNASTDGLDDPYRRFVSHWEPIDRQPATEPNISRDRVPAPSRIQTESASSNEGDGLPVRDSMYGVAQTSSFPQPVDASPPVASSPPPDTFPSGGRAAETTIRCTVCRGRGEVLWVGQTWSLRSDPLTSLEECENCAGSGYELIQVDEVAE